MIGNFDGVHRGHQAVIAQAVASAAEGGLEPLVLTFDPHPASVIGGASVPALTPLPRKLDLICRQSAGLRVVVEPFTRELAAMSPREFAEQLLVNELSAKRVLVGENFRFGRARAGDVAHLGELGSSLGFQALSAVLECDDEGPISSTRVRAALARGELSRVTAMLGRPHAVSGTVAVGQGRGRTIGVPTANLSGVGEALPPHGVYAVLVDLGGPRGFEALATGVANFGVRPTLGAGPSFEIHLFDFDRDIYGAELRVHLVERLRDERKFPDLDALRAQISADMAQARSLATGRKPLPSAAGAWY